LTKFIDSQQLSSNASSVHDDISCLHNEEGISQIHTIEDSQELDLKKQSSPLVSTSVSSELVGSVACFVRHYLTRCKVPFEKQNIKAWTNELMKSMNSEFDSLQATAEDLNCLLDTNITSAGDFQDHITASNAPIILPATCINQK
jgi:hypothetical protein